MDSLVFFFIEICISSSMSLAIIILLKPVLREVLIDSCGEQTRADFWIMFTQLMVFIAPLLLVVFFANIDSGYIHNMASALQGTLFRSLLGDFIALAAIGKVIWKTVEKPAERVIV